MDEEKRCSNCFYAKNLFATGDVLCEKKGVVPSGSICRKYTYNIFKAPAPKNREEKQYDEKTFSL